MVPISNLLWYSKGRMSTLGVILMRTDTHKIMERIEKYGYLSIIYRFIPNGVYQDFVPYDLCCHVSPSGNPFLCTSKYSWRPLNLLSNFEHAPCSSFSRRILGSFVVNRLRNTRLYRTNHHWPELASSKCHTLDIKIGCYFIIDCA